MWDFDPMLVEVEACLTKVAASVWSLPGYVGGGRGVGPVPYMPQRVWLGLIDEALTLGARGCRLVDP